MIALLKLARLPKNFLSFEPHLKPQDTTSVKAQREENIKGFSLFSVNRREKMAENNK